MPTHTPAGAAADRLGRAGGLEFRSAVGDLAAASHFANHPWTSFMAASPSGSRSHASSSPQISIA
jgi:hypothetical protein